MINYSFIIPHHNSPELLIRCLNSIPQRDDIQIIVVDDNSLEKKRPQVNRLDVEVVYIDAAHSKGAGHARNIGLEHAKGKWLLFADCDDYYVEGFLQVLDNYLERDIEVLYYNYHFVDGQCYKEFKQNYLQECISNYDGSYASSEIIRFQNKTPWTKMARRDFVFAHNMYFEEVPNGNDILFSLFVGYYASKYTVEKECIYVYNKNENSIVNKTKTFAEIRCLLTHFIKKNSFNDFVGHREWNISITKVIAKHLISCGIFKCVLLFVYILFVLPFICFHKKEWVHIFQRFN